jgi:quinol monooxygenase YgiN/phenylpyruvate tautomerase PptA (4-oxalocrotonate tautomerase family)
MPVIMVHTLDLLEEQKKVIAKKYTEILAELTKVPEERIYVFFSGYPLEGIAAGGVLNSDVPAEMLDQFITKLTGKPKTISVLTRMQAKAGQEEAAKQATLALLRQTRTEAGCLGYDLYQGKMDLYRKIDAGSYFVLQEKWCDQEAINFHLGTAHFKEYMAKQESLFDGPFEVTVMISAPADTGIDPTGKAKIVLRLKAQADKEETIKQGTLAMMQMMRAQPGCLRYDMYQGFEGIYDTSVFIADQIWADLEALGKAGQYLAANMPFFLEDLAEARQPIIFEMISEPAK